jgi:hypothetical protein
VRANLDKGISKDIAIYSNFKTVICTAGFDETPEVKALLI